MAEATVTEKLAALNGADLTALARRIAAMKAEYEKELATRGANSTATAADTKAAASQAGTSVEDLLAALETAKRRGLI